MDAVDAGRVGARPLSFVFTYVDPAILIGLPDDGKILLSQGGEGLEGDLFGLFICEFPVVIGHHGHIYVVHVQLVHAQHLFAERDIAVHVLHAAVNAVDQPVADSGVHVVCSYGSGKGGGIFPGAGVENLFLHLAVIESRPGVGELAVAGIVFFKNLFAQGPVRGHLQRHKASVGERDFLPFRVSDRREFQVRVGEHSKTVVGCLSHFAGRSQKLFHLLAQGVFLQAADLADRDIVFRELRLFLKEARQNMVRDVQDLRLHKCQLLADPDRSALHLQLQFLIMGVACVLVVAHEGVTARPVQFQRAVIIQLQRLIEAVRALAEASLKFQDFVRKRFCLLQVLFPEGFVRINILQTPCQFFR